MGACSLSQTSAEDTCLPTAWLPVLRRRETSSGPLEERENLLSARIGKQGRTCS